MFPFDLFPAQLIYTLVVAVFIAVLILTFIGLFGRHVYLELATHFRLQYALASLVCVGLFVIFHSWRLLPFAAASLIFSLLKILPYYSPARTYHYQTSAVHLRLILANVLWSRSNYVPLIEVIREANADIIALQEFTEKCLEHTNSFISEYPYYKAVPRSDGAGMALFSRYPLEEAAVLNLDASAHVAILAKVNVRGTVVTVLSLHPPTPVRTDKFLNRNSQFSKAASILRQRKGPRLLIGDLNTTMWSPYFTDLTRESGLRDARLGFGLNPSWPMPLPAPLRLPIDHCLESDQVTVEGLRTGDKTGSDHRPLIVDVRLNGPSCS